MPGLRGRQQAAIDKAGKTKVKYDADRERGDKAMRKSWQKKERERGRNEGEGKSER